MSWYAAHVVMMVERKERGQKHFPLWENIILLQAASEQEAFALAEKHGRGEEGDDDGTFRWDGHAARWVFAGVRKITACADASKKPGHGAEITYVEFEASSRENVAKFVEGKPVSLKVTDKFSDDEVPAVPRLVS